MQLFAQLQVLNVFNQFQLCACGSTVFGTGSAANAGGVNLQRIDTTVLTPGTTASRFATFNPFTDDAGARRELGLRPELRPGSQPLRLHDPADDQDVVRREVLNRRDVRSAGIPESSLSGLFTGYPGRPHRSLAVA